MKSLKLLILVFVRLFENAQRARILWCEGKVECLGNFYIDVMKFRVANAEENMSPEEYETYLQDCRRFNLDARREALLLGEESVEMEQAFRKSMQTFLDSEFRKLLQAKFADRIVKLNQV